MTDDERAPFTVSDDERAPFTVTDEPPASLGEVESRRGQLITLALIVLVLVAAGVVLFSMASGTDLGLLDFNVLRISFVGLAVVFSLYVWQKERDLRRTERQLIESQVRAAGLTNRLREISALSRAGREVSAQLSLGTVLRTILDAARDLLGATEGSVMLLDEDKRHLRVAAAMGLDEEAWKAVIPVGDSVAGWVAERRQPVILQGSPSPEQFPHFISKARDVSSSISVPLFREDEPLGVLNVSVTAVDRKYTDRDLEALQIFAEHAGIALGNARAYEEERDARKRLAEADERRQEFISTVTHDLKAPLTSILGYAKLLGKIGDIEGAEAKGFLDVIQKQGQHILDMVQRLVLATSLEQATPSLQRERLDLGTIAAEQIELTSGLLGTRRVETKIDPDLPGVFGDPSAVEHSLLNLLDNALKYAPDGTSVTIEIRTGEQEILISVVDDGPGIPTELLGRVFERYQRATDGGDIASVGLGLFIVQSLAQAHGGRAWAENEPGRGARITFTLPFRRDDR